MVRMGRRAEAQAEDGSSRSTTTSRSSIIERRNLLRQKLRYKRKVIFGIWALAFAYLSLSAEEVSSAPSHPDLPDTIPLSKNLMFSPRASSTNWKAPGSSGKQKYRMVRTLEMIPYMSVLFQNEKFSKFLL
jgi:hypothetical protein